MDALVAEIGSTTTVVSAFDGLAEGSAAQPRLLGQGFALTSVADGDVTLGVRAARAQLEAAARSTRSGAHAGHQLGRRGPAHDRPRPHAAHDGDGGARGRAGGRRGRQVPDRRPRCVTPICAQIDAVRPNLILLAGGVEGGDYDTVLFNAGRLTRARGAAHRRLRRQLAGLRATRGNCSRAPASGCGSRATSTRRIDELDIVPARAVIHDAFEEHITHAPGMERIGELVSGRILPTPGAVLIAAERLAEDVGDLVVVDVGGATTDVHSVTDGSPEIAALMIEPQPHSKRTVEGDLGTYVSAEHVVELLAAQERPGHLPPAAAARRRRRSRRRSRSRTSPPSPPCSDTPASSRTSTRRRGRQTVARGRDLTACRLRDRHRRRAHASARRRGASSRTRAAERRRGAPAAAAGRARALDRDYVFACCGALLRHFAPEAVTALMRGSAGV